MDIGESLERAEADPLADSERIYRLGKRACVRQRLMQVP
jgi:hypothetical protein